MTIDVMLGEYLRMRWKRTWIAAPLIFASFSPARAIELITRLGEAPSSVPVRQPLAAVASVSVPLNAVAVITSAPRVAVAQAAPSFAPEQSKTRVGSMFDGSRDAIGRILLDGEPIEVESALKGLQGFRPSVRAAIVSRAARAIRRRIGATIPRRGAYPEDDRARMLDAYDDVLRLLKLRGLLSGRVIYPLIGADLLTARWAPTSGMNWTDHRRAFQEIVKSAERPRLARFLAEKGSLTIARVEGFSAESFRRALRRVPEGPRTLILKYAFPYCVDAENRLRGLLIYSDWIDLLARESIAVGDHVVAMGANAKTFAYFESSSAFRRVPLSLPELARGEERTAGYSYRHMQALYFPHNLRVYRKDTAGK